MHSVLDKYGLGLEIPMTPLPLTHQDLDIPVLRLRDWVDFFLKFNVWHVVCGLRTPNERLEKATLSAFWEKYREQHPSHPIYRMAAQGSISLDRVCPMVLHGDEGRSLKRQPFLVCNFHSLLGQGSNPEDRRNARLQVQSAGVRHRLNLKGHSYCNRFLFGCMPKAFYTGEHEDVLPALISLAASEAAHMATHGVRHPRTPECYWIMTAGVTGDWPWLHRCGNFSRSFNNVPKKQATNARQRQPPAGICHLCRAGQDQFPYEQLHTTRPRWYATMYQQFLAVPHADGNAEFASFWKFDVFHVWHLGMGKHFLGSLLALLSETQPAGNTDERFKLLTQEFLGWRRLRSKTAQIRKITKELITWPKKDSFPVGSWHKGAVTTVLMEFAEDHYRNIDFSGNQLLQECMEAVRAANACIRAMYSRGVFLSNRDASFIGGIWMRFLRRYSSLAESSRIQGRMLFCLMPKGHAWHHLMLDMVLAADRDNLSHVVSPLCFSCQMDEDFVGRPSRLSRRVRPGAVQVRRVVQRYLKGSYREWIKSKLIRRAHTFEPA